MMPEMNGLELTAKGQDECEYSYSVILLTAKLRWKAGLSFEYGADVYIRKPFSIRQLQIENLLKLLPVVP